uniref:tRNA-intron lyase n=2 Tax=Acrobeloides nanus TaxID=290746 RepID=A0A914C6J3_9BILA
MVDDCVNKLVSPQSEFRIIEDEFIYVDELAPCSFAIFNDKDAQVLKEKYRIIGDPFDRPDDANSSEIPLLLMSEQVQVLLEQNFIRIRRLKPLTEDIEFSVQTIKAPDEIEDSVLVERAKRMVAGRKIKEQKRKLFGEDAPTAQKRVKKNDININDMEITNEELQRALKELVENQRKKMVEDDSIAVPYCAAENAYEILSSVEFPNDPEYRRRVTVFRDLWRKGFFLSPGTKYMVVCVDAAEKIPSLELISISRVATQVKKEVLLAVVAADSVIPYYTKINWWKGSE